MRISASRCATRSRASASRPLPPSSARPSPSRTSGLPQRSRVSSPISRAAGIHLVIATQQPSRQVIQGALDANMPCRVGLMTQSAIESRMLLQTAGAERLTGFGDLLYRDVGAPVRLQAPYLTPEQRARLFAGS